MYLTTAARIKRFDRSIYGAWSSSPVVDGNQPVVAPAAETRGAGRALPGDAAAGMKRRRGTHVQPTKALNV